MLFLFRERRNRPKPLKGQIPNALRSPAQSPSESKIFVDSPYVEDLMIRHNLRLNPLELRFAMNRINHMRSMGCNSKPIVIHQIDIKMKNRDKKIRGRIQIENQGKDPMLFLRLSYYPKGTSYLYPKGNMRMEIGEAVTRHHSTTQIGMRMKANAQSDKVGIVLYKITSDPDKYHYRAPTPATDTEDDDDVDLKQNDSD